MRIVFFGSDDFAAVCLKELEQSSHQVIGCVTAPDARQGRGMRLALSPIKAIALGANLLCLQPPSLKEEAIVSQLQALEADIFVVVAYGKILTQTVLNIPKIFCVNVHGSLLPHYRGAAPINWAIINGDHQTGVTIMKVNTRMDAGDIISQKTIPLSEHITADQLRTQMARVGGKLLVKTLDDIQTGHYTCTAQDESKATLAPKLTKEMGRIHWQQSAEAIDQLIRGLKPWPGTFATYKDKMLKILEASVVKMEGKPGTVVDIGKEGFVVACGQDSLLVKCVHPQAAKIMPAYDFVQGYRLMAGEQLT
ncbi:MAG: methionyl-tRNA formyltransferase [Candidatus Omnitrophica bacterium]|nr:methionyl-tRNA formyltransferase [Candidatus Omnitrophota bacterium]